MPTPKYTKGTVTSARGVTVTVDESGNFTYAPSDTVRHSAAKDGAARTDFFTVTVTDGRGGSAAIKVDNVPIVIKNTAPATGKATLEVSAASVDTLTGKTVGKITGVTDPDGDTPIKFSLGGLSSVQTTKALWAITPDGTLTYTPTEATRLAAAKATTDAGKYDTYTITAEDGYTGKSTFSVKVEIVPKYADYTTAAKLGGFRSVADITFSPDGKIAFISDPNSKQVTAVIGERGLTFPEKLPIKADAIAVNSDFSRAYITDWQTGSVSFYDFATGQATPIPGTFGRPGSSSEIAIAGDHVYVISDDTVSIIDAKTNQITATIARQIDASLLGKPGVVSSSTGSRIYVADPVANLIRVFDTSASKPRELTSIRPSAEGSFFVSEMTISPDGRYLYVADLTLFTSPGVFQYDRKILVIDTQNRNQVVATIATVGYPVPTWNFGTTGTEYMALSPDGKRPFVANPLSASVSAYDVTARPPKLIKTFGTNVSGTIITSDFKEPRSLAVSPDGMRLYVTNGDNTVTVVAIGQPTNSSGGGGTPGGGDDFNAPK